MTQWVRAFAPQADCWVFLIKYVLFYRMPPISCKNKHLFCVTKEQSQGREGLLTMHYQRFCKKHILLQILGMSSVINVEEDTIGMRSKNPRPLMSQLSLHLMILFHQLQNQENALCPVHLL